VLLRQRFVRKVYWDLVLLGTSRQISRGSLRPCSHSRGCSAPPRCGSPAHGFYRAIIACPLAGTDSSSHRSSVLFPPKDVLPLQTLRLYSGLYGVSGTSPFCPTLPESHRCHESLSASAQALCLLLYEIDFLNYKWSEHSLVFPAARQQSIPQPAAPAAARRPRRGVPGWLPEPPPAARAKAKPSSRMNGTGAEQHPPENRAQSLPVQTRGKCTLSGRCPPGRSCCLFDHQTVFWKHNFAFLLKINI